jgi:hypothetical protein
MSGIIGQILAGGVGELLSSAGQFAKDIRQAITGEISPEKKAEIEQRALEIEYALTKAQTDINVEEARHPSIFVAGWRPFIGWICGCSLGWHYIGNPLMTWAVRMAGRSDIIPPTLDTGELMTVLLAMLGLGGMRTFEKFKNSQANH